MRKIIKSVMFGLGLALTAPAVAAGAAKPVAVLYKNPQCDCCETYAKYLRVHGYEVKVQATHDLPLIKKKHGIPTALEGCHTTLVGGYVVEGHVPVKSLNKLLAQRPKITGISLPGMPTGSPGMMGPKTKPFKVFAFNKAGRSAVYSVE